MCVCREQRRLNDEERHVGVASHIARRGKPEFPFGFRSFHVLMNNPVSGTHAQRPRYILYLASEPPEKIMISIGMEEQE